MKKTKVLFIGNTVYSFPLNQTFKKKFNYLSSIMKSYIIAFADDYKIRLYSEADYTFFLIPYRLGILRKFLYFPLALFFSIYILLRFRVEVVIFQSALEGILIFILKPLSKLMKCNICFVVEAHSFLENSFVSIKNIKNKHIKTLVNFILKEISQCVYRKADILRTVSTPLKRNLIEITENKVPVVLFTAWTDLEVFLETKDKKREKQILFAGFISKVKGIHLLIEAFYKILPKYPDVKLKIIGKTLDNNYFQNLKHMVKKYNIEDKVVFIEHLSQRELAKAMSESLVLVLPSESEGLGRVLIEAMATGTPVIGSKVEGIIDVIDDGVNGFLFEKENVEDLARKLELLISNEKLRIFMGSQAREKAKTLFSPNTYIDGYKKVLELCRFKR